MLKKEGESKQAEQTGNGTVGVLYSVWPENSGAMRLFWNERLQDGEQMNRNFGIKLFLSQNWGHVFTPCYLKGRSLKAYLGNMITGCHCSQNGSESEEGYLNHSLVEQRIC